MAYHVVCRTCATEGECDSHESIEDSEFAAESLAEFHREANPGHDVRTAEVA